MRHRVLFVLRLVLSLGLLVFLISKSGPSKLIFLAKNVHPLYLTVAFVLTVLAAVLSAYKWQVLIKIYGFDVPLRKLTSMYFVGQFFNSFLPTTIGGDTARIKDLNREIKHGVESTISVFLDRFTGLIALLLIGSMTSFFLPFRLGFSYIMLTSAIILISLLFLSYLVLEKKDWLVQIPGLRSSIEMMGISAKSRQVYQDILQFKADKKASQKAILISIFFHALAIVINYILAKGIRIDISFIYLCMFVPLITLISMLPASINGIGVREGAYVFFLSRIGISESEAVALSLLVYTLSLAASLAGGVIYIIRDVNFKRFGHGK